MKRLDRMRKQYEQFTAAEGYIIGFPVGNDVYAIEMNKIPRRFTCIQKESKSNGGGYGLYVKVTQAKFREYLLKRAYKVGTIEDISDTVGYINNKGKQVYLNKGVMFEKLIWERNGQTFRGKDSVGFHKAGDITLEGKEIQVKYAHARICYDRTLQKLARASAQYLPIGKKNLKNWEKALDKLFKMCYNIYSKRNEVNII